MTPQGPALPARGEVARADRTRADEDGPGAEPANQDATGSEGSNAFGELLRRFRIARGASQAAVAARAGLDRSYVNRLETGERGVPAPPAVEALISALDIAREEADQLRAAAGLLPLSLQALGPADPTILLLAERLGDPRLSNEARAALRQTVETIVRHWGQP